MVALLLQQLLSSWIEHRKSRAHSTLTAVAAELRMSYQIIFFQLVRIIRAPARSTAVKNILGYSTRNDKFKHLEPHFKLSATRSASKEGTENAVALPHSRECTEEPISALPNDGSKEKFGGRAELWSVLQGKLRGRGGSSCRFDRKIGKKMFWGGAMQHRCVLHLV